MDRRRTRTELIFSSAEETLQFGRELGKQLECGDLLCFEGDLGAGKTTLIKGIAVGAAGVHEREVTSPTFSYLHIYEGKVPVYHFDLYRLKNGKEFSALGFQEYLQGEGIACIEWAERIKELIPPHALHIRLEHDGEERRKIVLDGPCNKR